MDDECGKTESIKIINGSRSLEISTDLALRPYLRIRSNVSESELDDGHEYLPDHHALADEKKMERDQDDPFEYLPDHIIIEILIRLPASSWVAAACVRKKWASLFRSEALWQTALIHRWPGAGKIKKWPGPIGRCTDRRRYIALHTSKNLFTFEEQDGDIYELVGHVYLYLKEQLEVASPLSYGLLHGTVIDQFLACGKKGNKAHELASQIWLAVINNLDDSERTFHLLMRIVEEWEVFLPYPYSKSHDVQWRLFERLFTDFRDCLGQFDYYSILSRAKHKIEYIPSTWLGF